MKVNFWLLSLVALAAILGLSEAQAQDELVPGLSQEDGDLLRAANTTARRGERSELMDQSSFNSPKFSRHQAN